MRPAHGMFMADDVAAGARRAAGAGAGGGAITGGAAGCPEILSPVACGAGVAWGTVMVVLQVGQLICAPRQLSSPDNRWPQFGQENLNSDIKSDCRFL